MPTDLKNPSSIDDQVNTLLTALSIDSRQEPEYHQAVMEVLQDLLPWIQSQPNYQHPGLLETILVPDRVIEFKVAWQDDQGRLQLNKGFRVQHTQALGPYKGGLRFHPSVNTSILKFLGFEQAFKNSLTGLPLGAGKGGSDFDPKGKSPAEIKRFCYAFIDALFPFIGPDRDVPAGDIGVSSREIGFMMGRLTQLSTQTQFGSLTGKAIHHGGSHIRPEATGYGCVYFLEHMLEHHGHHIQNKRVLISGAGNVALYAAEKCLNLGAKVISLSDSGGVLVCESGLSLDQLNHIQQQRIIEGKRLKAICQSLEGCDYQSEAKPWQLAAELALPCATQNELTESDAIQLCNQGLLAVSEGANMPCTPQALQVFHKHQVLYGPGKAANAGGVAVSGLEMAQNNMGYFWSRQEVDVKLRCVMEDIHRQCYRFGEPSKQYTHYARGANIAGFKKLADALIDFGVVT